MDFGCASTVPKYGKFNPKMEFAIFISFGYRQLLDIFQTYHVSN